MNLYTIVRFFSRQRRYIALHDTSYTDCSVTVDRNRVTL